MLYIVYDFDKKNAEGKKDFLLNAQAVARLGLPPTYAERSKGGEGIHLAYYYDGDVDDLSHIVEEGVEIKTQIGDSALRRRVGLCNDLPVAHISSGLPLRRKKAVINEYALKDARHLHNKIMMALRKEVEPKATRTSMMYIRDCLKEAQEKNIAYDFSQLDRIIYSFAANSTNSKDFCLDIYNHLKLKWPEEVPFNAIPIQQQIVQTKWVQDAPIVIFDVEVFKNVFIVVYKNVGPKKKPIIMINPKPYEIEQLFNMRLVGFNNRGYDNFILWACFQGYTNIQLYDLSQEIIVGGDRCPERLHRRAGRPGRGLRQAAGGAAGPAGGRRGPGPGADRGAGRGPGPGAGADRGAGRGPGPGAGADRGDSRGRGGP